MYTSPPPGVPDTRYITSATPATRRATKARTAMATNQAVASEHSTQVNPRLAVYLEPQTEQSAINGRTKRHVSGLSLGGTEGDEVVLGRSTSEIKGMAMAQMVGMTTFYIQRSTVDYINLPIPIEPL